jgi:(E)-4-hydroxy-3-methylbut-2-enyl-diphosphate synthase
MIKRRNTKLIKIGNVEIGRNAPVSIQSMIKLPLSEYRKVKRQTLGLKKEGCEILRVAFKKYEEKDNLKKLLKDSPMPIEVDIHFDYKLALEAINLGADAIRINPGNIRKKSEIKKIVEACREKKIPIRVGVNVGSLPPKYRRNSKVKGSLELLFDAVSILESFNFYDILVSAKSDSVIETYEMNLTLSKKLNYPVHIGVTATGSGESAIIKSAIGIGSLLMNGIGDTIRVSLAEDPKTEVKVAKFILSSLGLRQFGPQVIACPGCGRAQIDVIKIAKDLQEKLFAARYSLLSTHPIKVAIMGCEVNGPGEAKDADIGIAGGKNRAVLFKKGKLIKIIKQEDSVNCVLKYLNKSHEMV